MVQRPEEQTPSQSHGTRIHPMQNQKVHSLLEAQLWNRAEPAPNHDPNEYRLDRRGYLIARSQYGTTGPLGWFAQKRLSASTKNWRDPQNFEAAHVTFFNRDQL